MFFCKWAPKNEETVEETAWLEPVAYLSCNNDDLQQLQDQLVRFATFGVIFIAGAHEEVF